jgi:hypothetical protein
MLILTDNNGLLIKVSAHLMIVPPRLPKSIFHDGFFKVFKTHHNS